MKMENAMSTQTELKEFATQVHALLKRGICKGALVRNKEGEVVSINDSGAVEWCSIGALRTVQHSWKSSGFSWYSRVRKAFLTFLRSRGYKVERDALEVWHDSTPNKQILKMWQQFIDSLDTIKDS